MNLAAVHKKTGVVEFFLHDEKQMPPRFFENCDHLRWVTLSDDCTEQLTAQLVAIRLVSHHLYPPIPIRSLDWGVCVEGQEEEGYRSYGVTEGEALSDFIVNYEPPARPPSKEERLRAALIDALALLEHYAEGRPGNWDGSTKKQALTTIREGRELINSTNGG